MWEQMTRWQPCKSVNGCFILKGLEANPMRPYGWRIVGLSHLEASVHLQDPIGMTKRKSVLISSGWKIPTAQTKNSNKQWRKIYYWWIGARQKGRKIMPWLRWRAETTLGKKNISWVSILPWPHAKPEMVPCRIRPLVRTLAFQRWLPRWNLP